MSDLWVDKGLSAELVPGLAVRLSGAISLMLLM